MSHANEHLGTILIERTYENALKLLGELITLEESKAAYMAQSRNGSIPDSYLQKFIKHLAKIDVELHDLDSLHLIHVAGTKGKGSTCAFTESILRHGGLRTGLYGSPHLVTTRERIKINGKSLSELEFTKYFFIVHEKLVKRQEHPGDMPTYFGFMTCLAFYVFLQEKIEVGILEVGVGGTHCSTNIIRSPVVVGITSIGLDHHDILGRSLEEIAMSNAGIMKSGCRALTVGSQSEHILELLRAHAKNTVKCPFYIAPPLDTYNDHELVKLGVDGGVISKVNASLALQLSNIFLSKKFPQYLQIDSGFLPGVSFPLSKFHFDGLENCKLKGRFQKVTIKDSLSYYLDGAHTRDSLDDVKDWFLRNTNDEDLRFLVFHLSSNRDPKLMEPLLMCQKFQLALFCPLVLTSMKNFVPEYDNWAMPELNQDMLMKCEELKEEWKKQEEFFAGIHPHTRRSMPLVPRSINHLINYIGGISNFNKEDGFIFNDRRYKHIRVLVTGSFQLVGSFLSVLD